jgi:hypothetical protein
MSQVWWEDENPLAAEVKEASLGKNLLLLPLQLRYFQMTGSVSEERCAATNAVP